MEDSECQDVLQCKTILKDIASGIQIRLASLFLIILTQDVISLDSPPPNPPTPPPQVSAVSEMLVMLCQLLKASRRATETRCVKQILSRLRGITHQMKLTSVPR